SLRARDPRAALVAAAALRERGRLAELEPRARELSTPLVAVAEVEERAHRRIEALARGELRARFVVLLLREERARLVEERLGRDAVLVARLGVRRARDEEGDRKGARPHR